MMDEVEASPSLSATNHTNEENRVNSVLVGAAASSQNDCGDNAETMMDAVDSCVACMDGIQQQHDFENTLMMGPSAAAGGRTASMGKQTTAVADHGLTDAETALIRLQVMEEGNKLKKSVNDDGEDMHDTAAATATMDTIGMLTLETLDLCGEAMEDPDVTVVSANNMAVFTNCQSTTTTTNTTTTTTSTTTNTTSTMSEPTTTNSSPIVVEKRATTNTTTTTTTPTHNKSTTPLDSTASSPEDVLATFHSIDESSSPSQRLKSSPAASTSLLDQEPDIDGPPCCAICFDEAGGTTPESVHSTVTFCHLPCCGSNGREETSTTKICTACILLLTSPTNASSTVSTTTPTTNDDENEKDDLKKPSPSLTRRIGRCPRCRHWIAVSSDTLGIVTRIEAIHHAGKCKICNQEKEFLVQQNTNEQVCDSCFLGRRRPLIYECEQCHATQRIPHPMYRYQASLQEFGKNSWACQGLCQNFTMWRILPQQVRYIPPGDTPESWCDDYLEVARERVREARQGIARHDHSQASGEAASCVIS